MIFNIQLFKADFIFIFNNKKLFSSAFFQKKRLKVAIQVITFWCLFFSVEFWFTLIPLNFIECYLRVSCLKLSRRILFWYSRRVRDKRRSDGPKNLGIPWKSKNYWCERNWAKSMGKTREKVFKDWFYSLLLSTFQILLILMRQIAIRSGFLEECINLFRNAKENPGN